MRYVAGMGFTATDGTVESMHTFVRDDRLHGCRFTDDAAGRSNAVLLEVTDQAAHPQAADLFVVAQRIMKGCVEAVVIEGGDELGCLRQGNAYEPLHVCRTAGIKFAVALGGH